MVHFDDASQANQFNSFKRQEAEQLAQMLSVRYGLPYVNLATVILNQSAVRLVPEDAARKAELIVYAMDKHTISAAVLTPNNPHIAGIIESLKQQGYTTVLSITSQFALERAWETYKEISHAHAEQKGIISISDETMQKYVSLITSLPDIRKLVADAAAAGDVHSISRVAEIIMGGAVATNVSDIHIEPEEHVVRVRFRLDGVLQDVADIDHTNYKKVLSRIKLLAGVKLNVTHEAQDGRFTIKIQGIDVEVRTSILPAAYQESIVMRILNPKSISVPMEELGMDPEFFKIMQMQINRPNGLILTTGPTGSGKTTTLYAILKKLANPGVKIITIEDPIEYHLEGISQTQVDHAAGYDFGNGLRAAVRQDPDVIMVGEIRDEETASIAIDSALTGHLVFSTLHTNNAAGAIPRLIDLGVNPKIISSSLNITLAQRLVRKLCPHCKEEYVPEGREREFLEQQMPRITEIKNIAFPEKLWRPKGCEKCTFLGFKGRISIYEGILMDAAVEDVIRGNPSEHEIIAAAHPQNILDMRQDGIVKAINGITSLDELERVVGFEESRM